MKALRITPPLEAGESYIMTADQISDGCDSLLVAIWQLLENGVNTRVILAKKDGGGYYTYELVSAAEADIDSEVSAEEELSRWLDDQLLVNRTVWPRRRVLLDVRRKMMDLGLWVGSEEDRERNAEHMREVRQATSGYGTGFDESPEEDK